MFYGENKDIDTAALRKYMTDYINSIPENEYPFAVISLGIMDYMSDEDLIANAQRFGVDLSRFRR